MGGSALEILEQAKAEISVASDARTRLQQLFDDGSFTVMDPFGVSPTGRAGVGTGYGTVNGGVVYAFSQNVQDESGAMGRAQWAKIKKVYELALKTGCPVVGIYDSMGARLAEADEALAGYGELLKAAGNLSGVVPQVAIVAGVCAGAAAIAACSADLVIMSEKAELFLTPPFVAKAKGDNTPGAGSAANAARAGVAHLTAADDKAAVEAARKLLAMLPANNLETALAFEFGEPAAPAFDAENMAAAAAGIADAGSATELQAAFGEGVYTAFATVSGTTAGLAATKGVRLTADDSAKLARFVALCDAFHIPVVTLVNTPGFEQSSKGELAGSIREAAKLTHVYAEATTPKISVIAGEACGAAYVALAGRGAGADMVFAWPGAVISALEPETAVALMGSEAVNAGTSREQAVAEYKATKASALAAARGGAVDNIIEPQTTRAAVVAALDVLASKREHKLPKKHGNIPM